MPGEAPQLRAVLYARKSSEQEDRQVLSISSQTDELQELAQREGLEIVRVVTEAASAKAPGNRPVFASVLAAIEAGEANAILGWHPNRLSRNSVDSGQLVYLMDLGKLQGIVTPSQTFRNSPSDKFLLGLLCGQAKLENDNKRDAVLRGMRAKLKAGWFPGRAPIGYRNDPTQPKGLRQIHLDPDRAPLIRQVFSEVLRGVPPMEVLRRANEEWGLRTRAGKSLAVNTFYRMLARPFYCGEFEYPEGSGVWYPGAHEALVSKAEFDQVQEILGKGGCPRGRGCARRFAYTGLVRCGECGGTLTAERKVKRCKNSNVHRYTYYHCVRQSHPDCAQGSIEVRELERQLGEYLARLSIPAEFHTWALEQLQGRRGQLVDERQVHLDALRRAHATCTRKLDRLLDLRLGDELTEEVFARKSAELEREKWRLQEQLDRNDGVQEEASLAEDEEALDFCRDALERFRNGSIEEKRELVAALVSNLSVRDGIVLIQAKESIARVLSLRSSGPAGEDAFEPLRNGSTKTKIAASSAPTSIW